MAGNKEEEKEEKRKHVQINQTKIGSSPSSSSSSSSSSTREFPFTPLRSLVDEGFWHRLSFLKLNKYGIDDSPIPITGFYAPCTHSQVSNHLTLLAESFANDDEQSSMRVGNRNRCPVPGIVYNTNTWEDFRALDRKRLLKEVAQKIWEDIRTGRAVEESSVLSRFLLISFADLKKWTFYYWFAFPALVLHPPAKLVGLKPASKRFTAEEAESVSAACNAWRSSIFTADVPFFLVSIASNSHATVRHLKDWEACQADSQKVLFGFYDPCHCQEKPGWPLCNLLALVCSRWNLNRVHFLCYKENRGFADMESSLVGEASMEIPQGWSDHQLIPNAVGWECNKDNKYAPRCINLAKSMDPIRLAITAANLNLQLMRWRQVPSLNIDKLTSMKCLILGAGALGCNVARLLMGWGVRKIALVDNGRVAVTNPLRQSLFTFNDCLNGGELKALAAARSLKEIFPAAEGEGVVMAIPMPGPPVTTQEESSVVDDCRRLHDLVDSHDAVFLLTDTRESQWLPSLLCASANKIAISVALGFDSFLAMRHGPGPFSSVHDLKTEDTNNLTADVGSLALTDRGGKRLGCYFCNDVVVPTNPTFNRTLDQQCTVTRPGLAALAAAYAVELFANLLQHPDGIFAVGYTENSTSSGSNEQPLGILPHQIRGSLYDFSLIKPVGHSSNSCTACCGPIVSEYQKKGMEFLLPEINHPTCLGDVTGLTELKKSANSFELDRDKLSSTKCLLLGAGTLGCNVARLLMDWGVRKITLLDNGRVAMSNPLRQSLFTFNDCLNGGELKALAAARSLKHTFPAAEAEGVVMAIPMPGHPVSNQEENSVVGDFRRLHDLVDSHDVVFLLTDTRESRWLPSLLCASANKIAITAALGFDSFLAMRHGPGPFSSAHDLEAEAVNNLTADVASLALTDRGGKRLGCYFCNDVVAPTDSTSNRSLDQQCTVTRPGLAYMAAAVAVELFVNLLQHPDGIFAEGYTENHSSDNNEQPIGILPHQIRGSLYNFSQMKLVGHSSNSCTACCGTVVSEYRKRGMDFLLQAINHPTYLEDLTGLTELKKSANSFEFDWDNETDDYGDDDCVEL